MELNNKSNEEKKNELNNKLETLIYQKDTNISLFIAELDRIFGELLYLVKYYLRKRNTASCIPRYPTKLS